jgi:hypothetical protein
MLYIPINTININKQTLHPASMPAYPGTEENSWWTAVGCTLLAIASVSSETAQGILPDDFISHVLGSLADGDFSGIHVSGISGSFDDHKSVIHP